MNREPEPEFLTREIVEAIHDDQIETRGGLHGFRDENALESAIEAARNVYRYGGGDPYEIAAAYAYHIVGSQAYCIVDEEFRKAGFSGKFRPICIAPLASVFHSGFQGFRKLTSFLSEIKIVKQADHFEAGDPAIPRKRVPVKSAWLH